MTLGKIKNLLGVAPDKQDFATPLVNKGIEWVKHNVIVAVSSLIGFLLGCKLG